MSRTRRHQRQHRRKVAGTAKGLEEHEKREKRRGTGRPKTQPRKRRRK